MDCATSSKVMSLAKLLDFNIFFESSKLKVSSQSDDASITCRCGQTTTARIVFYFRSLRNESRLYYYACDECNSCFKELLLPLKNKDVLNFMQGAMIMLFAQEPSFIDQRDCSVCPWCTCYRTHEDRATSDYANNHLRFVCIDCQSITNALAYPYVISARTKVTSWAAYVQRAGLLNKDVLFAVCLTYMSIITPLLDLSVEILKPFLVC